MNVPFINHVMAVINMAGLIKELLLDYGLNKLSIDQRSDISIAITKLFHSGVITQQDIDILNKYISGYTAQEIGQQYLLSSSEIEATLSRLVLAIETISGYTDQTLIQTALRQKRSIFKVTALQRFLTKHGQHFNTHDIINGINN